MCNAELLNGDNMRDKYFMHFLAETRWQFHAFFSLIWHFQFNIKSVIIVYIFISNSMHNSIQRTLKNNNLSTTSPTVLHQHTTHHDINVVNNLSHSTASTHNLPWCNCCQQPLPQYCINTQLAMTWLLLTTSPTVLHQHNSPWHNLSTTSPTVLHQHTTHHDMTVVNNLTYSTASTHNSPWPTVLHQHTTCHDAAVVNNLNHSTALTHNSPRRDSCQQPLPQYCINTQLATTRLFSTTSPTVLHQHTTHHDSQYCINTQLTMTHSTASTHNSPWLTVLHQHTTHHDPQYCINTQLTMTHSTASTHNSPWLTVLHQHTTHHDSQYCINTQLTMTHSTASTHNSPWLTVLHQHTTHHDSQYCINTQLTMTHSTASTHNSPWPTVLHQHTTHHDSQYCINTQLTMTHSTASTHNSPWLTVLHQHTTHHDPQYCINTQLTMTHSTASTHNSPWCDCCQRPLPGTEEWAPVTSPQVTLDFSDFFCSSDCWTKVRWTHSRTFCTSSLSCHF